MKLFSKLSMSILSFSSTCNAQMQMVTYTIINNTQNTIEYISQDLPSVHPHIYSLSTEAIPFIEMKPGGVAILYGNTLNNYNIQTYENYWNFRVKETGEDMSFFAINNVSSYSQRGNLFGFHIHAYNPEFQRDFIDVEASLSLKCGKVYPPPADSLKVKSITFVISNVLSGISGMEYDCFY